MFSHVDTNGSKRTRKWSMIALGLALTLTASALTPVALAQDGEDTNGGDDGLFGDDLFELFEQEQTLFADEEQLLEEDRALLEDERALFERDGIDTEEQQLLDEREGLLNERQTLLDEEETLLGEQERAFQDAGFFDEQGAFDEEGDEEALLRETAGIFERQQDIIEQDRQLFEQEQQILEEEQELLEEEQELFEERERLAQEREDLLREQENLLGDLENVLGEAGVLAADEGECVAVTATANEDETVTLEFGADDAESISVFRADADESAFEEIATLDGDATTFVDEDMEAGETFRFAVTTNGFSPENCPEESIVETTAIPFFPGIIQIALAVLGTAAIAAFVGVRRRG